MVEDKIYVQKTTNNSHLSIYKLGMYMLLVCSTWAVTQVSWSLRSLAGMLRMPLRGPRLQSCRTQHVWCGSQLRWLLHSPAAHSCTQGAPQKGLSSGLCALAGASEGNASYSYEACLHELSENLPILICLQLLRIFFLNQSSVDWHNFLCTVLCFISIAQTSFHSKLINT